MAQQAPSVEEEKAFPTQWGLARGGNGGGSFGPILGINGIDKRIDAVRLYGDKYVDSIQFRVNGQWQSKHGGNGGDGTTLVLGPNEYISSVGIRSGGLVDRLTFYTNFNRVISKGGDGGASFGEPGSNEYMLTNMRGRSDRYLDQIQFEWTKAIKVAAGNPLWGQVFGGNGGEEFPALGTDGIKSKITGVRVWGANYLDAIEFQINRKEWKGKHGGDGGDGKTLLFDDDDEYIQDIVIRSAVYVDKLKIITNKLRVLEIGGNGGSEYIEGGSKRLIDVRGRSAVYVDQLQFLWMDANAFTYHVTSVIFDVDDGKILDEAPMVIGKLPINNDSDSEQWVAFAVNKSVSNSSNFEDSTGITTKLGTSFEHGIPGVAELSATIELTNTTTYTWGETNSTSQTYMHTFNVKCPPRSSVIAQAIVTKATLDVPYTMTLENGLGDKQQTKGIWKGVTTYHLRLDVDQIDQKDN